MRLALTLCIGVLAAGCGGGSGGPTTPGGGTTAPAISTSNTSIFIGQSVQFNATGGGTMRWGGDNPAVATVDQTTGRVTGVGNGRVTIWAENESGRTTRLLRGMPSFAGNWQGSYNINGCQSNGVMTEIAFCQSFPTGSILSFGAQLSQTDDRVTGSIMFGSAAPGTVHSTTVAENGVLPLTATVTLDTVTVVIENARFESPSPGAISGTFDQRWTVSGAAGSGVLISEVRSLTRVSGGPAFGFTAPAAGPVSIEDLIRLVRQRRP